MVGRDKQYNGVLLFNKPIGVSSHEAVLDIRRSVNQRRVGHTGTLDPQAEGLLVICLGKATKITQFLSALDKTYDAEICLGQRSSTYDSEGIDLDQAPLPPPEMTDNEIRDLLDGYRGKIKQKVPAYSAVRVGGQHLYRLTRSGISVELPEREIEIKEIQLLGYRKPHLQLRITCSGGTYIRSLAHDLGEKLGCGAYLSRLRRTVVGELNVKHALDLVEVKRYHKADILHKHLLSYDAVLGYSAIIISDDFKKYVASGKTLTSMDVVGFQECFAADDLVLMKDTDGQVLAVGMAEAASDAFSDAQGQKLFRYIRVLS